MPIGKSPMSPDSTIETFIACKLNVDTWRWAGAPFYLPTGKYMKQRKTEIAIRFHQALYSLFRGTDVGRLHPNWIILRIQPDEGIALEFAAKRPGQTVTLGNVKFDFAYNDYFKAAPNTGYETLIYDCLICSNIRLDRALGNDNGAHLDTLVPHVWGHAAWEGFSASDRSKKRGQLRAALDEIADRTRGLQGGMGWTIGKTNSGLVRVSRPKELPFLEGSAT